jgi:DNA adenine methylase
MMRFSKKGHWNIPFCQKPDRFAQAYVTKICNQVDNVSKIITPEWNFVNQPFSETIETATSNDYLLRSAVLRTLCRLLQRLD